MIPRIILVLALVECAAAQSIAILTVDTGSRAVTGKNVSHAVVAGYPVMSYYETRTPDFFAGFPVNRASCISEPW